MKKERRQTWHFDDGPPMWLYVVEATCAIVGLIASAIAVVILVIVAGGR